MHRFDYYINLFTLQISFDNFYRFDGSTCIDVDECVEVGRCLNGNCVNTEGSFSCDCFVGYEGDDDGSCRDKNECEANPV